MVFSSSPSLITPSEFSPSKTTLFGVSITKLSDTTVMKIGELSRVINTTILNVDLEITRLSDSAIFRSSFVTIDVLSDSRIKDTNSETKVLDSRIKNTFENAPLSDTAIFRTGFNDNQLLSDARIVEPGTIVLPSVPSNTRIFVPESADITKLSNTWIRLDFLKTSDSTIFNPSFGLIDKLSDTAVFRVGFDDKTKLSDSTIYRSGFDDKTKLSDTRIFRPGGYTYPLQGAKPLSDTRIIKALQKDLLSRIRIKNFGNEITKLLDTLIKIFPEINKISDSVIRVLDSDELTLSSRSKIITPFTLNVLSDATINLTSKLTKLSDTFVIRNIDILKISNATIFRAGFDDKTKLSDTLIMDIIDIIKSSDTTIFNASFGNIEKFSETFVSIPDNEITKISDSTVLKTFSITKLSDASIRRDRSNIRAIFQKSRQV